MDDLSKEFGLFNKDDSFELIPMFKDDPAMTLLRHSDVGEALFNLAVNDNISFYRLKSEDGDIESRCRRDLYVAINERGTYASLAHELKHQEQTKLHSKLKINSNYNSLMVKLIEEADAFAISVVVAVDAYRNMDAKGLLNDNGLCSNMDTIHISKAFTKLDNVLRNSEEGGFYSFAKGKTLLDIARSVFDSYLLKDNAGFNRHLSLYSKRERILDSVNALKSLSANFDAKKSAQKVIKNISFGEIIQRLDIGKIPGLEGNYITDVDGVSLCNPAFFELQKKVEIALLPQ